MDMAAWPSQPQTDAERAFAEVPVDLSSVGMLRRDSWSLNYDNYRLGDATVAIDELARYRAAGGRSIVDLTNTGLSPDPVALRETARAADVQLIAGCGLYIQGMHPRWVANKSVEQIAELMVSDVRNGIAGTDVRAGIIGEIGTSETIHPDEEKVLRAAARAQRITGAAINVHTYPWARQGLDAATILDSEGADLRRVVISHLDNALLDLEYHRALAERGVYLEYDGFGKEWYVDSKRSWFPRDYERIAGLRQLIDDGYLERLLIGCDVCLKMQLCRYGGWGYEHLTSESGFRITC
jgi:phosphotriesterase-related protein